MQSHEPVRRAEAYYLHQARLAGGALAMRASAVVAVLGLILLGGTHFAEAARLFSEVAVPVLLVFVLGAIMDITSILYLIAAEVTRAGPRDR